MKPRIIFPLMLALAALCAGGCQTAPKVEQPPPGVTAPTIQAGDQDGEIPAYKLRLRTQRGERVTEI